MIIFVLPMITMHLSRSNLGANHPLSSDSQVSNPLIHKELTCGLVDTSCLMILVKIK
jgi:hypothetical protein